MKNIQRKNNCKIGAAHNSVTKLLQTIYAPQLCRGRVGGSGWKRPGDAGLCCMRDRGMHVQISCLSREDMLDALDHFGRIFLPSGQKNRAIRGSASLHSPGPEAQASGPGERAAPLGLTRPSYPLRSKSSRRLLCAIFLPNSLLKILIIIPIFFWQYNFCFLVL
jgi:hypothetical protein